MSENAKRTRKQKGSPLEKQLEEAATSHDREYEQWYHYWKYGGQDPCWPDGCNMQLIRNHIIYYKRQMKELCEQIGCELPECYAKELPPEVDSDYMARPDEIRDGARIALEKMEQYPAYVELLGIKKMYSLKQLETICYFNVVGYVKGLKIAIARDDLVSQRRYGHYKGHLESFDNCLKRSRELESEEFQFSIFDLSA